MFNKLMSVVIVVIVYVVTINHSECKVIGSKDQYEELKNGLYSASDDVVVLNYTNLKSAIGNGTTAWLVEFYNSWCGYCQRFAPTWKAVAKSVVGWSDIVTVAAIDCSTDDNNPLCRDYEIMRYPTIRYFSIGDRSIGVDVEKAMSEEEVRHGMIEQLQKDQQEGKGSKWPNIAPYRSNDSDDWIRALPPSVQYHFFLFEEATSYLGSEVILDLHTLPSLQIRRVTKDNVWLTSVYRVKTFPSLIVLDRENSPLGLELSEPTREGTTRAIQAFLKSKGHISEPKRPARPEIPTSIESKDVPTEIKHSHIPDKPPKDALYQADLENALRYSLEREIPLKKRIEGVQLEALKAYLKVLSRYFPLRRGNSEFLTKLYNVVSDRPSITGENFKGLVTLHQQEMSPVFTENREWIGCSGSSPQFRGYPCGLWTLFHTLTVSHAEAFEDEDPGSRSVGMVLRAMHGYISNFFGCADCADHFVQMATERNLFDVETVDNAVLWLWRAHNEVNQRLAGDATEDPAHPKIQYPSQQQCEACRYADGFWNSQEVLRYLKRKHGVGGIQYGLKEAPKGEVGRPGREPLAAEGDSRTVQRRTGWDFTVFDISILVVLYVASAGILVLVCVQFAVKKSMRKKMFLHTLLGRV
ncbi:sulfhydryl oxidase 1 [Diachasma alloeum]|uniref:sulfhydryl oxidase 1 n=1 Tax=Diachasma alloeum TaxID=454923 RepID=UPI000738279C|nr:sulfhydryl oxidase 1 [Diachasma alloeum]